MKAPSTLPKEPDALNELRAEILNTLAEKSPDFSYCINDLLPQDVSKEILKKLLAVLPNLNDYTTFGVDPFNASPRVEFRAIFRSDDLKDMSVKELTRATNKLIDYHAISFVERYNF